MIRRGKWDVVGVDILHLFEHREERDLAQISRTLNKAAKASGAHVLATVHLNEHRAHVQALPPPALGDIRGSGMLKNDADNVMFVYRERDANGQTLPEGTVFVRKSRHGETGSMPVHFSGHRTRFEARDSSLV
jgi:replicative DNA helicase